MTALRLRRFRCGLHDRVVSEYMPFVEQALGKPCERKRVDDLDVAQCW